ncbi:L-histidine N(alpha)-methyltransferase [Myxococcota bacterium]|nr:L-histidine N(alpha)-methyltransferase [Myxococcota bacterium]
MKKKPEGPSQLMELFLSVAESLGLSTDRELADLAGVSVETVANWRTGVVQEFKPQKLGAIKEGLAAQIAALRDQARIASGNVDGALGAIEVELGSGPTDLQRQFRDRVAYDYLGHRFLYFDPPGALAWENLIRTGYEQDLWLSGVESCVDAWLDTTRDVSGHAKGPIAEALGLSRRTRPVGLDLVSLGPGEGGKELIVLDKLLALDRAVDQALAWLCFAPVDVSIPLLLTAASASRKLLATSSRRPSGTYTALPFCADFEEGKLSFLDRIPTARHPSIPGVRLVTMLGNIFGNVRDEELFVRQKLWAMTRPGDLVWLEVGLRAEPLENDPLFRLTVPDREETSAEANRRLLLEGPYRRWEAAMGRKPAPVDMRIWVREDDDASRVPGSCNFCHDLVLKDERRVCTMLYSRRYQLEGLTAWLERLRFEVLRISRVEDSKRRPRVAHLLLRRTS